MRPHRDDAGRGQALVEFALVVPIFLLLVFGLVDLGRAIYVNNAMAEAARDGARWGSVQARSATPAGLDSIASEVAARMTAVPDPTIEVSCVATLPALGCRTNDTLVVEIRTELDMISPFIGQIFGSLDLGSTSRVVVNN
jgi:Flp pilus assembly protein TadG